jgi:cytochrome c oxidase subunit 2
MNQRGKPPARTIIALALIVLLGIVTVVAAVTVLQLPDPATAEAKRTHTLYQPVLAVSLVVFFGVTSGIIWAIFRYKRQSPDEELPVQVHGSNILEATWTTIPIIILVILFIPSLILLLDLKTPLSAAETDLSINVTGHQWYWEFQYPDSGIDIQKLPPDYENLDPPHMVVPVGADISITLTSTDVVHSFYAPHTLYKLQAIPGNVNTMHLKFEEVGVFTGQCYQFCGLRHSDMRFVIDVRSQADYDAWVKETQAAQGIDPAKLATKQD